MTVHFCVHDEGDSVGVVVVEGIKSGQALNGWIMDQDKMIAFNAKSDIPIGHKLAVRAIAAGDTIIKYGVDTYHRGQSPVLLSCHDGRQK